MCDTVLNSCISIPYATACSRSFAPAEAWSFGHAIWQLQSKQLGHRNVCSARSIECNMHNY